MRRVSRESSMLRGGFGVGVGVGVVLGWSEEVNEMKLGTSSSSRRGWRDTIYSVEAKMGRMMMGCILEMG